MQNYPNLKLGTRKQAGYRNRPYCAPIRKSRGLPGCLSVLTRIIRQARTSQICSNSRTPDIVVGSRFEQKAVCVNGICFGDSDQLGHFLIDPAGLPYEPGESALPSGSYPTFCLIALKAVTTSFTRKPDAFTHSDSTSQCRRFTLARPTVTPRCGSVICARDLASFPARRKLAVIRHRSGENANRGKESSDSRTHPLTCGISTGTARDGFERSYDIIASFYRNIDKAHSQSLHKEYFLPTRTHFTRVALVQVDTTSYATRRVTASTSRRTQSPNT